MARRPDEPFAGREAYNPTSSSPSSGDKGNRILSQEARPASPGNESLLLRPASAELANPYQTENAPKSRVLCPRGTNNGSDALKPKPDADAEPQMENNPFAFSAGQLSKMFKPKSLGAFQALGGKGGLEKGLRTHRSTGASTSKDHQGSKATSEEATSSKLSGPCFEALDRLHTSYSLDLTQGLDEETLSDRKRVFDDSVLSEMKAKTFPQLLLLAYNDTVLILLTLAAAACLGSSFYQYWQDSHTPRQEWIEGFAIICAIVIVVLVGAANDWTKQCQLAALQRKKQDRSVKVVRSGRTNEIPMLDILVGDVLHLEPGDLVPADGSLVEGYGIKCDESMVTGQKNPVRKVTLLDESLDADSRILAGSKILEGIGKFAVVANGIFPKDGQTPVEWTGNPINTFLPSKTSISYPRLSDLWNFAPWKVPVFGFPFTKLPRDRYPVQQLRDVNSTYNMDTTRGGNADIQSGQRSFLPVFVEGILARALPDTEVDHNVVTEAYASSMGAVVDRDPGKQRTFTNAVGRRFRSSGIAELSIALLDSPGRVLKSSFAVLKQCADPLVLGESFLRENEIFTKVGYSHSLIKAPSGSRTTDGSRMFRLMHMNQPRQKLACTVDSKPALANADTGSELDLVSLRYARSRRWSIKTIPKREQCRVMLANEEVVHLAGYVEAKLSVKGTEMWKKFYVLKGLVCDVILGDATLESLDAFKKCQDAFVSTGRRRQESSFCMIRWVERFNKVEHDVDKILGRQFSEPGEEQKQGRWSRLLTIFSSRAGDPSKTPDLNEDKRQLRHHLDEADILETERRNLMTQRAASLRGSGLSELQRVDRDQRSRHTQLRNKILKGIQDLSASENALLPRCPHTIN